MTATDQRSRPRNGFGSAALVLAIVGLALCWSVIGGVIAGVVAAIIGLLGRGRAVRGEADNGGVAVGGIALGVLSIVVSLAFAVIWANAFRDAGGGDYLNCVSAAGTDQRALDGCMNRWLDRVQTEFSVTLTTPAPGST